MLFARLLAILPVLLAVVPGADRLSGLTPASGAGIARISQHHPFVRPPLYFELNRGQADRQVRFMARGPGSTLFLTSRQAILTVTEAQDGRAPLVPTSTKPARTGRLAEAVLRLQPVGLSHPSINGLDPLPGRVNYLIGHDPRHWHTDIPTFARVEYRNVYPGIDLAYHGNSDVNGRSHFEYDWIVRPPAREGTIRVRMHGEGDIRLDGGGGLLIRTGNVSIRESRPIVYQVVRGKKSLVSGHYVLAGHDLFGFAVGEHDPHLPLIIDPGLLYSTYLGGGQPDAAESIAVDGQGNTYVTGYTESNDFPLADAAQGVLSSDPSCAGPSANRTNCDDAFVTKLSADGSTMLYSTYLGGTLDDDGHAIAVDAAGDAYVTGDTLSPNFPTATSLQPRYGGGSVTGDAFVAALKPAGDSLIYSTYLGGQADDIGEAIAVSDGSAYVTGRTDSPDFPTLHAFQASYRGGTACGSADSPESCSNAFIARFTAAGSLAYSTYLGGSRADEGRGIAALNGEAYVTGATSSPDFPTAHAFQPSIAAAACTSDEAASHCTDAFVSRVSNTGSALIYSTYLGGAGVDTANAIAVDAMGSAYVVGDTFSSDFPVAHAYKPSYNEEHDSAFVSKLDPAGSSMAFSTYLGGSMSDEAYGVAVDAASNLYVVGTTLSPDFPLASPIQRTLGTPGGDSAPQNGFISEFNSTATSLLFSTYFGGGDHDLVAAIALDRAGNLHLAGMATSDDFPVARALQPTAGGTFDGWVAEITNSGPSEPPIVTATGTPTPTVTPTNTPRPTATATSVPRTSPCKRGSRLIHGKCVKRPTCKKGFKLVHGKCRKSK